jgi:arabinofuranan 3-O-arabinosyltransferase
LVWRLLELDVLFWELSAVSWLLLLPYILTAHGHLDFARHAIGRDFVNYWTAGHLVFTPHRLDIFTPSLFLGWEHRLFDPELPFHFWSYPPPALFLVAPLALFPYIPGLIVWSLAGIAALVRAARVFFEDAPARRLLVVAPAVAVNIGLGQNGAFTAALLLGGLALWDRKPRWSGVLLGLLIFKPQLAILLPIAVIAERRWTILTTAALTVFFVLAFSTVAFGVDAWRGFFGPGLTTQGIMLSQGRGPFQWMMPSAFMAGRVAGLSSTWAMAAQVPCTLLGLWLAWRAYRSDADRQSKAAVLLMATFLASPQMFNYDLIPGAVATLVLWRRDQSASGVALALMMWALPVLLLAAEVIHIAVGPFILAIVSVRLAEVCGVIRPVLPAIRWRAWLAGPR